jgi:hypothetical protein
MEMSKLLGEPDLRWEDIKRAAGNSKVNDLIEDHKQRFAMMKKMVTFEKISRAFSGGTFDRDFEIIQELYEEPNFDVTCV